MLSDAEYRALREMQRQLAVDDPEFVQLFGKPERPRRHPRRGRSRLAVIVTEMITAFMIMDPQPLTESQMAALNSLPAPRRRVL